MKKEISRTQEISMEIPESIWLKTAKILDISTKSKASQVKMATNRLIFPIFMLGILNIIQRQAQ
ncbi:hypothetical protein [Rhodonellum sp.]|uniref:hypothetical protein n=1 Tax=Rhodonellum sp. TaxID=2231180 RepID=UPI0027211AC2|nr:hypothetical protein [Rhodonellum sp.]MDO9553624.1 hypothetical protein [Rhodonellum sp.]